MPKEKIKDRKRRIERMAEMDDIVKKLCAISDEVKIPAIKTIAYDIRVWNDSINRRWT